MYVAFNRQSLRFAGVLLLFWVFSQMPQLCRLHILSETCLEVQRVIMQKNAEFLSDQQVESATEDVVRVQRVVDGDTFVLDTGESVRLIGIDAPEKRSDAGKECFADAATTALSQKIAGKTVRLETDKTNTDRYGRLLRYVYLEDEFVNAWLVREGFAREKSYHPDVSIQLALQHAEALASSEGRGLWSACDLL